MCGRHGETLPSFICEGMQFVDLGRCDFILSSLVPFVLPLKGERYPSHLSLIPTNHSNKLIAKEPNVLIRHEHTSSAASEKSLLVCFCFLFGLVL